MDLPQLEYFLAVADELSFTRGADRMHVAQSAVSRAVARLEREFGLDLFVRDGRNVTLTPAGERLVPMAQSILDSTHDTKSVLADMRDHPTGQVRIGISISLGASHLSEALVDLAEQYPDVDVRLFSAPYQRDEHAAAVARGTLDLALVVMPTQLPEGMDVTHLGRTRPVLVAAPGHELLDRTGTTLDDLGDTPFIDFPQSYTLRALVDAMFATRACRRNARFEVDSVWAAVDVLRGGRAVTILPEDVVSVLPGALAQVPLQEELGDLELVLISSQRRDTRAVGLVRDMLLAHRSHD